MTRLRGGRGPKQDQLAGNEFLAQRAENSRFVTPEWFVGPSDVMDSFPDDSGYNAAWMQFELCKPIATPVKLTHAHYHTRVATASATVQFALYHLDGDTLRQIPGSLVEGPITASDTHTYVELARPIVVRPNMRLFLAYTPKGGAWNVKARKDTILYRQLHRGDMGTNEDLPASWKHSQVPQLLYASQLGTPPIIYMTRQAYEWLGA